MASAKMSGFGITELYGKVGGNVIQRNANGLFVRDSPIPTQPGTIYQVDQQAVYSTVFGHWATLTEEQRAAWIAFAETPAGEYQDRLGDTQNYTGQQLFVKLNLAAFQTSFPIEDPPTVPSFTVNPIDEFSVLLIGTTLSQVRVQFQDLLENPGITVKFYVTAGLSPGIMRPRGSLFKLTTAVNGDQMDDKVDFPLAYFNRFGAPTEGKKVFVRVIFTDIASGYEFYNAQSFAVVSAVV